VDAAGWNKEEVVRVPVDPVVPSYSFTVPDDTSDIRSHNAIAIHTGTSPS
jgi:hypothetical protein